jgi:methyl-accepting chemotaxis protein
VKILKRVARPILDMSIRWKSVAIFASLLLVVGVAGVQSVVRLGLVKSAGTTISASWMPGVQQAGEIVAQMNAYRLAEAAMVVSPDEDTINDMKRTLTLSLSQIRSGRISLGELPTTPEANAWIAEFDAVWVIYIDISKKIIRFTGTKKLTEAADLLTGDSAYQFDKAKVLMNRVLVSKVKGGDDAIADGDRIYRATLPILAAAMVVVVMMCLGAAAFVIIGLARPLKTMTNLVERMASGHLDVADSAIPGLGRGDEFGALATALSVLRDSARERVRLERTAAETRIAADVRQNEMERHTQNFGSSVSGVMDMLGRASDGIREQASVMTQSAESTRTQADQTSAGSRVAAKDLASVAAAAEEMATSANEIGRRIGEVTASTNAAVEAVNRSGEIVTDLVDAVAGIGSVVELISKIADQTNLLALNATIEAARAGEAGKGFAVVAGEVKALAMNTRQATEEVNKRILIVRSSTNEARTAINGVTAAISHVRDAAGDIAASIRQQGNATREIASSVQSVSALTEATTRSMTGLADVAVATSRASKSVLDATDAVREQSETLRKEVDSFLQAARSALVEEVKAA